MTVLRILSVLMLAVASQQAFAWGDDGHKAIALIAQRYLEPAVDELGQHVSHPRERIDCVQLAGFNEGGDGGPVLGTDVVTAKSAFLRLSARPRMERSTVLESISMRPSSRNRARPSQWLSP